MNNNYYKKLLKLAKKSLKCGDVPVGAIIVRNNKIISEGYNKREKENLTINHAEIVSIIKANKKLKSYFLYDCDMYVTLKPCEMCMKVINNARLNNIFYILDKPESKKEYSKTNIVQLNDIDENEYKNLLRKFFNKLRNK